MALYAMRFSKVRSEVVEGSYDNTHARRRRGGFCVLRRDVEEDKMTGDTFTVKELADAVTGGNVSAMAKLLNGAGAQPRLDELTPTGGQVVSRSAVIDLYAMRVGDYVGRKLAMVLRRGDASVLAIEQG